MSKNTGKKVVVGTIIGLVAGYITGLLTAPKSGKETRQDIKDGGVKAIREAEKRLKVVYVDLSEELDKAILATQNLSGKAKKELTTAIGKAKDAQQKAREVLSAVHEGDAEDPDLKAAIKQAINAKNSLADFIKKHN